jgi:hypothetical protein
VARRALILSAIVCRSNSDHDPTNPAAIALWNRLKAWIESLDVASEIEPAEKEMIYAPLGSLDKQKGTRAMWRAEGLGILAWALGRFPFPKYGEKVDPYELGPEQTARMAERRLWSTAWYIRRIAPNNGSRSRFHYGLSRKRTTEK